MVPKPGSIVSRKVLETSLGALGSSEPADLQAVLTSTIEAGRANLDERLLAGATGAELVAGMSLLMDECIRALLQHITLRVSPNSNPLKGERLTLVAVGGYGRGEMAPYSDLDLLFLLPYKATPWQEQVIEGALYMLWDLGLKVGHAVRTVDDTIRRAKDDMTIRTAVLESRFLWGDRNLFRTLQRRFGRDVVAGSGPEFVRAKLEERDTRHIKLGDSRYVLEPNVKEGKGGQRDLHTLFWIAKYLYRVGHVEDLAEAGVLTRAELSRFRRASDFLARVRWHLHVISGRAEERLTFDLQTEIATRMGFSAGRSQPAVERFMKRYFLVAKDVGDLTRIFAAAIEDAQLTVRSRPRYGVGRSEVEGFPVLSGRLAAPDRHHFGNHPRDLVRFFQVAQKEKIEIHPRALWQMTQNLHRIDNTLRADEQANAIFMDVLTSRNDPERALRTMNEAGVMGRFLPDFGRVVAQMQHDMYHVYTVDEHSIRAIGVLSAIEDGHIADELPLATAIFPRILQRRVLYLAVLLHDIAKGRGGDHSVLGAEIAEYLGPRLGFNAEETETVAWLVRHHLAMSNTAMRRDLTDPQTIEDFAETVQSMDRLRLLLVLTVADIRAVGPKVWNGWKGELLRELYYRAEETISGGHGEAIAKQARVGSLIEDLRNSLSNWDPRAFDVHVGRLVTPYWLAFDSATHLRHAEMIRRAEESDDDEGSIGVETRSDAFRAVTEVTVFAPDQRGLFARLAGAIAVAGASIVDARIFTTLDGKALDTFWVQDERATAFDDERRLDRLKDTIRRVGASSLDLDAEVARRRHNWLRGPDLPVTPRVLIDNNVSTKHSLVEVTARDRVGLLFDLAQALTDLGLSIVTARVATYGERAVDAFYVRNSFGLKITHKTQLTAIREGLLDTIARGETAVLSGAAE
ncbi:MAG: [protein-PII] uridylyltransferase [Rhodospirillaceae bacterium]|nr:[protein-PII] uridylyltransferase [Rhodospirillaceae bacterium]MBT6512955.1 [protein-PII] uridylyltransferase [Rhodospirillaceae bacterium]MBT7611630.1 [protein-PII] uridylyltransferase [Rhodospirillaceae bacterium]